MVICGSMYLALGLFFPRSFGEAVKAFPMPVLGVILLFESLALMMFVRDIAADSRGLFIALLVALSYLALPNGYVIGIILGSALHYLPLIFKH